MKRVLFVGLDPATVDFSDPALPPGMSAEKIHAGVKLAIADIAARGWQAEICFINPDETAVPAVERRLAGGRYDCVVVGAAVACRRASWRCSRRWSMPSTALRCAANGHRLQYPPRGQRRRGRALDLSPRRVGPLGRQLTHLDRYAGANENFVLAVLRPHAAFSPAFSPRAPTSRSRASVTAR
jgi:hypothetical protein